MTTISDAKSLDKGYRASNHHAFRTGYCPLRAQRRAVFAGLPAIWALAASLVRFCTCPAGTIQIDASQMDQPGLCHFRGGLARPIPGSAFWTSSMGHSFNILGSGSPS